MTQIKRIFHRFNFKATSFLFLILLSACNNTNNTVINIQDEDTSATANVPINHNSISISAYKDTISIWVYDYNTSTPIKNKEVKSSILTPKKLVDFINSYNNKVHLDLIKTSNDTIYVKIKESTYLTQQMGTTGATVYMSTTTYTLTELKGIKYVNFDFEAGDHASPGTYSRQIY